MEARFKISSTRSLATAGYKQIPKEGMDEGMKIMVSACLAGENCKYNGGNNRNEKVLQWMADNEVIMVCPEQMGGLPTPRVPSEIKEARSDHFSIQESKLWCETAV